MDIDRFLATNQPVWDRLAVLCARADRHASQLSASEIDELVRLYRRSSTHLSYVRTWFADPALTARLTGLVARAAVIVYGTKRATFTIFGAFFTTTFPASVWRCRRFVSASAALTFVPAAMIAAWLATSARARDALAPPALRQVYLSHDFASYYSSQPSAQFAAQVTTNNIRVAFFAFAGGILLGVVTIVILIFNGANLGFAAGLFTAAGQQGRFFGLVAPHGLLELSAVIVAGGAGLRLGWTLVVPGDRLRRTAIAEEGRRAVTIVLGLVLCFVVAGSIEGFITGSSLPTAARVGVGVGVEALFVVYIVVAGRAAEARGLTGALGEEDRGWAPQEPRRPSLSQPSFRAVPLP